MRMRGSERLARMVRNGGSLKGNAMALPPNPLPFGIEEGMDY